MTINQSLTYPNWLNNVLNVQKFPISKLTPYRIENFLLVADFEYALEEHDELAE